MRETDGGILFRVDGSHVLGMGHVIRCLSLATALKSSIDNRSLSLPIYFATRHDPAVLIVLGQSPFSNNVRIVSPGNEEIESFHAILNELRPRVVITDIDLRGRVSYYSSVIYPGALSVSIHEHNYRLLSGDIVIAPTVRPLDIAPGGTIGVTHFNGPEYILLSPDIPIRRNTAPKISEKLDLGFVSFGGSDPNRLTIGFLDYLIGKQFPVMWDFVLGPAGDYDAGVLNAAYKGRFRFHDGSALGRSGFLDLLGKADLVVTNGGTTLYESLAMCRPTISIAQNSFEADVVRRMVEAGACVGSWEAVDKLVEKPADRIRLAKKGGTLIDGKGCERVAELVLSRLDKSG